MDLLNTMCSGSDISVLCDSHCSLPFIHQDYVRQGSIFFFYRVTGFVVSEFSWSLNFLLIMCVFTI